MLCSLFIGATALPALSFAASLTLIGHIPSSSLLLAPPTDERTNVASQNPRDGQVVVSRSHMSSSHFNAGWGSHATFRPYAYQFLNNIPTLPPRDLRHTPCTFILPLVERGCPHGSISNGLGPPLHSPRNSLVPVECASTQGSNGFTEFRIRDPT